ncbi:hypothetical protein Hanom_Chr00s000003g01603391 [Helianthus anomalus]
MKESTAAPSESEIDLGVFSKNTGNHLEKIFKSASAPCSSSKSAHSRPKEDDVKVDQTKRVVENVVAVSGRDEVHVEGVETEYESSEATPQGTIYTKRVRTSGGSGDSNDQQGPEFHRVKGGSWTTHNPACDHLPHAPRRGLT